MRGGGVRVGRRDRAVRGRTPGFGSRHPAVRVVTFLALIVATVWLLTQLATLVGLPDGYDASQRATARSLATREMPEVRSLQRGAVRDMGLYVPAYLLYGLIVVLLISPRRSGDGSGPWWRFGWLTTLTKVTLGLLVATAAADMVETVLFHRSLGRLLDGAGASGIGTLATVTRAMYATKVAFAAATLIVLAVNVFRGPRSDRSPIR